MKRGRDLGSEDGEGAISNGGLDRNWYLVEKWAVCVYIVCVCWMYRLSVCKVMVGWRGRNLREIVWIQDQAHGSFSARSSTLGQVQMRCESPYTSSSRPAEGQNLLVRSPGTGYAACARE